MGPVPPCVVHFAHDWDDIQSPTAIRAFRRPVFVVDDAVDSAFVREAMARLAHPDAVVDLVETRVGAKVIGAITPLWSRMVAHVADGVVAIGGGKTSDLAGFAAATYQRGIPHALVPTTTLGMLDASIGGKTGIDVDSVKNSVGAMHHPVVVVNVLSALETLPLREYRAGLAEAVKAGVLFSSELLDDLERHPGQGRMPASGLLGVIERAASIKARVTEGAHASKQALLYGHAVGHALETTTSLVRHGEAIAVGMTIEGGIGVQLGVWAKEDWRRQTRVLERLGLPTHPADPIDASSLIGTMLKYRKLVVEGQPALVLPSAIGRLVPGEDMPMTVIESGQLSLLVTEMSG